MSSSISDKPKAFPDALTQLAVPQTSLGEKIPSPAKGPVPSPESTKEGDLTDFKIVLPRKSSFSSAASFFKKILGRTKVGIETLQRQAEIGDVDACYELAKRYEKGYGGVSKHIILAEQNYQKACDKNHPKAQVWIAQSKEEEASKTRRYSDAQKLFLEADILYQKAEGALYISATRDNDREAQQLLARMYAQKSVRYHVHSRKQDTSTPKGRKRRSSLSELEDAAQNMSSIFHRGDVKGMEAAKKRYEAALEAHSKAEELDSHLPSKSQTYDPLLGGFRVED